MKFVSISLLLLSIQLQAPENGNLISEPTLSNYHNAQRAPGILGMPEEVQDSEGNPATL